MKLVSCFIDKKEIAPLVEAGADELYTSDPGLPSFDSTFLHGGDVEGAIEKIHSLGARALVAVNSHHLFLDLAGMRRLERRLRELDGAGADAFIVASPSLLQRLKESGRPLRADLHLSSVQPCFNTDTLRLLLPFGIRRVILPTQLGALEAAALLRFCRREKLESEIFDYRFFGCAYVNGRCNLHLQRYHTFREGVEGGSICRCGGPDRLMKVSPFDAAPGRAADLPLVARRLALRMGGGGAPRLYNAASFFDFFSQGAGWLKFGVRAASLKTKVACVRRMRSMADLAEKLSAGRPRAEARRLFIEEMSHWRGE